MWLGALVTCISKCVESSMLVGLKCVELFGGLLCCGGLFGVPIYVNNRRGHV